MRKPVYAIAVTLAALVAGQASAAPAWYEVTFTGADMFNYTTGIDTLANQEAPRRYRTWNYDQLTDSYSMTSELWTNTGTFQAWASGPAPNLQNFQFAMFNLWGDSIPATSWDQPFQAVPDKGDGAFGVNSWSVVQSPAGWTSGIVMANQPYNTTDAAFPVWRATPGNELTYSNAASTTFSFDVLIQNPESAFGPDGKLRVWFGGYDQPDDYVGSYNELGGIMELDAKYIPAPSALLLVGIGSSFVTWLRRRSFV